MRSIAKALDEIAEQGDSLLEGADHSLAAGANTVVDLQAGTGFVVYAASGTPTQQPCDAAGTGLPGTSAANVTRGERIDRVSHYVKVTAPAGAAARVLVL